MNEWNKVHFVADNISFLGIKIHMYGFYWHNLIKSLTQPGDNFTLLQEKVKTRTKHYEQYWHKNDCFHGIIMITNLVVDLELESPLCDRVLQCYIVIITLVSVPRCLLSPESSKHGTIIWNKIFHLSMATSYYYICIVAVFSLVHPLYGNNDSKLQKVCNYDNRNSVVV